MKDLEETAQKLGFKERLKEIQFLAVGPFRTIEIKYKEDLQHFDKKTIKRINEKWREHLKKAPTDFPDPMASLRDFKVVNGRLLLYLQRSRFDFFIGTKSESPRVLNLRKKPLDNHFALPISFGAITITEDNHLVCGIRKKVGLEKGMLHTIPSGYFNPVSQVIFKGRVRKAKTFPSLPVLVATELKEELNLDWFTKIEILGLVQDCIHSQQPIVNVRLHVGLTNEEIQERAKDVKEIGELLFVKNEIRAIKKLQKTSNWTTHDIGRLILHFALP